MEGHQLCLQDEPERQAAEGWPRGPLTAHISTCPGFCPVFEAGGARRISWFTSVILYMKVLRCRGACHLLRFPEQCSQQRCVQSPVCFPGNGMKKCQPRDHSLGQALPPGFVAPTRIVWLDLSWICPLCLPLYAYSRSEGGGEVPGGGGSLFLSLLGCQPQPPFPGGKSLRPACSVLRAAWRGATGVPVIHLSRGCGPWDPSAERRQPFPGTLWDSP